MYQLHAFNARGDQLSRYVAEYGNEHYSITFARSDDYSVITWTLGQYASGYTDDGAHKRNRIAYFEILDGAVLLARAARKVVTSERKTSIIPTSRTEIEIRPVVAGDHYADAAAQTASKREGDPRYSITREGTGAATAQYVARFCFNASTPDGGWIGAADDARDAYAMARAHYAERHPSPDQAASDAYRAMMADPFGPTDPRMPHGASQSDAPARSDAPPANATPDTAPADTDAPADSWTMVTWTGPDGTDYFHAHPGGRESAETWAVHTLTVPYRVDSTWWDREPVASFGRRKYDPEAMARGMRGPVEPEFTPNPYWGDVATCGVAMECGFGAVGVAVYRATDGEFLHFATAPLNPDDAVREAGFRSHIVNRDVIEIERESWYWYANAANWPATSGKFSNGLAERLHDSDFPDETMGDVEGFGRYSLFRAERAILATDSQGFVTVEAYGTEAAAQFAWDTLGADYERHCMAVIENALPTDECEDVFLIFDTAKHVNVTPDRDEISEHVRQCRICLPYRYTLDEF